MLVSIFNDHYKLSDVNHLEYKKLNPKIWASAINEIIFMF